MRNAEDPVCLLFIKRSILATATTGEEPDVKLQTTGENAASISGLKLQKLFSLYKTAELLQLIVGEAICRREFGEEAGVKLQTPCYVFSFEAPRFNRG